MSKSRTKVVPFDSERETESADKANTANRSAHEVLRELKAKEQERIKTEQAHAERQRALRLLNEARDKIEGRHGPRIFSMKAGDWIYAMHLDGAIHVIENKTGRTYARSVPGNPLELDPAFAPVTLDTP